MGGGRFVGFRGFVIFPCLFSFFFFVRGVGSWVMEVDGGIVYFLYVWIVGWMQPPSPPLLISLSWGFCLVAIDRGIRYKSLGNGFLLFHSSSIF